MTGPTSIAGAPAMARDPAAVPVNTVVLRQWLQRQRGVNLADYEALRRWSVADVGVFWQAMWDYFDLRSPTPFTLSRASSVRGLTAAISTRALSWKTT